MFEWKDKTDEWVANYISDNQSRMYDRRQVYHALWELLTKLFRPRRYDMLGVRRKGQKYGANIFDPHPANALGKYTGGKLGYMVSRTIPWIQIVSAKAEHMRIDRVKGYCQGAAEQILYAARRSTMYSSLHPHSLDADTLGTSCVVPMFDIVKDRVHFDVVHPKDSYIMVDKYGDPIVYHRDLKLTRLTAVDMFGKDAVPTDWFREGELKEILKEEEFIWAVYPNNDRGDSSLPIDLPYAVFCILKGQKRGRGRQKGSLIYRSGNAIFPIIYRSGRESGAEYGTSLAADCLTAAMKVNKLGEKQLMAAHLAVEPAMVASKATRAQLLRTRANPGSFTYVDDIARDKPQQMHERLNWPVSDAEMKRWHEAIDDVLFIRFFEMLSSQDASSRRTIYEVSQMMAEKATLMSTIVGTFEEESLEKYIQAIVMHETNAGRMPDVPPELWIGNNEYDYAIRYLGPLDQLQQMLLKTRGTMDAMEVISKMAVLDTNVPWKFNFLEAAEEAAVALGWPQKFVNSDETIAMMQQQAAQSQAAMQQAEIAEKGAKASAMLSKRVEPGSMMDQVRKRAG
uniref:Putative head tail connector protein n=1 Tax=viral metagenome TaxID=1070528 RepID=A0A6M3JQ56_9ZZZZ